MYEITRKTRQVKGRDVQTYTRDICNANILRVEAGSTGYKGGDTGYGSRTYFRITDEGCTDMDVNVKKNSWGDTEYFEVELGGDTELETMIEALKFITQALEDAAHNS